VKKLPIKKRFRWLIGGVPDQLSSIKSNSGEGFEKDKHF
jgi:hypothetical protein